MQGLCFTFKIKTTDLSNPGPSLYSHKEFLFVNTLGEAPFCKTMLCALAEGFHLHVFLMLVVL